MTLMIAGLLLFFGCHFATLTPALRDAAVARIGKNGWGGVMSLFSVAGFVLIGFGWGGAPQTPLFAPLPEAVRFAPVLVSIGLVLFVIGGFGFNGHIRNALRHPMLIGVAIWAATHLAANGNLRETLLFGSFLAFSLIALGVLLVRGKHARFVPRLSKDVLGVALGLAVSKAVMLGHLWAFGVPAY